MSVGLWEAGRRSRYPIEVALAVDLDESALEIYRANFPGAAVRHDDVSTMFPGLVGSRPTVSEGRLAKAVGRVDFLVGGPPCQGHSDLNNHTRREDPKNALYLRMARAAEILRPAVVVIENVAPVQWDRAGVVAATVSALERAGYRAEGQVLDLRRIGVPQRRKRFVLLATRFRGTEPARVLGELSNESGAHPDRTVRWAIGDLGSMPGDGVFDSASTPSAENAKRMDFLFNEDLYDLPNHLRPPCHKHGNHSYVSMYGRLRWTRAAQTITTGFGSMGQGRYVHPERRRTLTPHEAARLQTFPDWFSFAASRRRGTLATVIGNAVPPFLMVELGRRLIPAVVSPEKAEHRERRRA